MTDSNVSTTDKKVRASPTKDFFVKMITRDIALEDCIFDLLDNAIDGAHRQAATKDGNDPLKGYWAEIAFDRNQFRITDNCGGIRLSDAIDYAFHFGRRPDSPTDVEGGIGLYGIGMKRAIFKIGGNAEVVSDADTCFMVSVDVEEWSKKDDWDFEYESCESIGEKGTRITITNLNAGIDTAFSDPVFRNDLLKLIARDYAFFIDKGFLSKTSEKAQFANIMYRRPLNEISEIRDHLGSRAMSYREIGIYTFEYFRKMELGK